MRFRPETFAKIVSTTAYVVMAYLVVQLVVSVSRLQ